MIRKLPNTTRAKLPGIAGVAVLLAVWQLVCVSGLVPSYMLPSPAHHLAGGRPRPVHWGGGGLYVRRGHGCL